MASPSIPPVPLARLDIEAIRVAHERTYAARVEQHPLFGPLGARLVPADAKEVRRGLMASSLRLIESMAPEAHQIAHEAQRTLGVSGDIELYQRSGPENAAIHLVAAPILLEIQGSLLPRLDGPAMLGLFGHELGHYLAHGPDSPIRGALAIMPALGRVEDAALELALSRLSMVTELTADRVALLACQDLGAMLRLEMVTLTGLSSGELTWDTEAYLAQCRELIEAGLRDGSNVRGVTADRARAVPGHGGGARHGGARSRRSAVSRPGPRHGRRRGRSLALARRGRTTRSCLTFDDLDVCGVRGPGAGCSRAMQAQESRVITYGCKFLVREIKTFISR